MRARRLLALASAAAALLGAASGPQRVETALGSVGLLRWDRGRTPVLVVTPRRGEGWIAIARRLCGDQTVVARLRSANPALDHPMVDRPVAVPMELLAADRRLEAVERLFPVDRRVVLGWQHRVLDPFGGGEEGWTWLAEVFTGTAGRARDLERANPELAGSPPRRGSLVLVPEAMLLPVFRRLTPVATPTPSATATRPPTATRVATATRVPSPTPQPSPSPTAVPAVEVAAADAGGPGAGPTPGLGYSKDARGEYAVYRLRRGEALYSAVVVRFTGQLQAAQVNATAVEIARRSGIDDVTSIPVGYPIRIPLDLLLPEFLPPGHPRRLEWEAERRELARFFQVVKATDLTGVLVVLDSGHGGGDPGSVVEGVWEATYAYDIMCRIKSNLERHTRATVRVTIEDDSRSCTILPRDRLPQDRDQRLLTHPPYTLDDASTGVHLRWYLANDILRRGVAAGVDRTKTVFVSVHADSLHPSVRGAMVYVPARSLRPQTFTVNRSEMRAYREYRASPTLTLGTTFKARSEASSRHLAESIVSALERENVEVHEYEPVRDSVLRGRRRWVPAVLRYSEAQHAVLLECCNMANPQDRAEMLDSGWRERFARAVVAGMAQAFGGPAGAAARR